MKPSLQPGILRVVDAICNKKKYDNSKLFSLNGRIMSYAVGPRALRRLNSLERRIETQPTQDDSVLHQYFLFYFLIGYERGQSA